MENKDHVLVREMRKLTEPGCLPGGLLVAGSVYRDFTIRLSTGHDELAIESSAVESKTERMCALFARTVTFAGLPAGALTVEALLDLPAVDRQEIIDASNRLYDRYVFFRRQRAQAAHPDGGDRGSEA